MGADRVLPGTGMILTNLEVIGEFCIIDGSSVHVTPGPACFW